MPSLSVCRLLVSALAFSVFSSIFASPTAAQQAVPARAGDKIAGNYICVFRPGMSFTGGTAAAAASAVAQAGGALSHVYSYALRGFAARMSDEAAARMPQRNLNVAYCEQDQVVTLPAAVNSVGNGDAAPISAQADSTPWSILRVMGGTPATFSGTGRAWVIDTGIALHPDLNVVTTNCRSFVLRSSSCSDGNGHGTHVAGTIGAKADGSGVVGVAPNAVVIPVRVLYNRGSGTTSGVIAGVDWVAQNGVEGDVANMSLGGGISQTLDNAVVRASAKVLFVIAAGNSATSASKSSPARAEGGNVFTISAYNSTDNFASFSNYGNPPVDWAGPGVAITSTWLKRGYNTISGTSMAAPHIAGLLLYGRSNMIEDTTNLLKGDTDGGAINAVRDKIAIFGG